jgi:outer membrane murein-binding lipoprotein Lpp
MNRIFTAAAVLAVLAISGCASLPDSIKGPFARSNQTATDVTPNHVEDAAFPAETGEGKF